MSKISIYDNQFAFVPADTKPVYTPKSKKSSQGMTTKTRYVSIEVYEQFLQISNEMARKLQDSSKN